MKLDLYIVCSGSLDRIVEDDLLLIKGDPVLVLAFLCDLLGGDGAEGTSARACLDGGIYREAGELFGKFLSLLELLVSDLFLVGLLKL